MTPTARLLTKAADYLSRNPNAFAQGKSLGAVLADHAALVPHGFQDAIEVVREAIGMSGVVGSLAVWSRKHSTVEAAALLRRVAQTVTE